MSTSRRFPGLSFSSLILDSVTDGSRFRFYAFHLSLASLVNVELSRFYATHHKLRFSSKVTMTEEMSAPLASVT